MSSFKMIWFCALYVMELHIKHINSGLLKVSYQQQVKYMKLQIENMTQTIVYKNRLKKAVL